MTKYKLPPLPGEMVAHHNKVDAGTVYEGFYVEGEIVWVPLSLLTEVPPPLPPEPPVDSFVHLASYYGVYERADRGWIATSEAGGRALDWVALVRLNSGDTPVRLVPALEPVELPWYGGHRGVTGMAVEKPTADGDVRVLAPVASEYLLSPEMAREMARALNTAADQAEREATDA